MTYEYEVYKIPPVGEKTEAVFLNSYARKGWKLISTRTEDFLDGIPEIYYYFERPIQE